MRTVAILKSRLSHPGGLEKYTRRLADAFAQEGCRVQILTTGEATSWGEVEVLSLCKNPPRLSWRHLVTFDTACQAWIARYRPSLVFGMERNRYQTHYRAGSGVHAVYLQRRALTDSRCKTLSFSLNPLHRYLLRNEKRSWEDPELRLLFTNSAMVKEEILSTYAVPGEKVVVVHNGVAWQEREEDFKKSFCLKRSGPFHFLFVGNGFARKGLSFLLKGLKELRHPFQLTVVGKDKNEEAFMKEAASLPVRFVGEQKEVTPFYQAADALVIPSIYDPFANVTLEALAMGLFVLSSPYNGGKEILQKGTGIVFPNLHQLTASLEEALSYPKTFERAYFIRHSIKELSFSSQLGKIVERSLW